MPRWMSSTGACAAIAALLYLLALPAGNPPTSTAALYSLVALATLVFVVLVVPALEHRSVAAYPMREHPRPDILDLDAARRC